MKIINVSILSILLCVSGCAGTMDSIHVASGSAPINSNCELAVINSKTLEVLERDKIKGDFSVQFIASGPYDINVNFQAICNGKKVKEITNISARSKYEHKIGSIERY